MNVDHVSPRLPLLARLRSVWLLMSHPFFSLSIPSRIFSLTWLPRAFWFFQFTIPPSTDGELNSVLGVLPFHCGCWGRVRI